MNERVQRALDGELDRSQLSAAEAAELAAAEELIIRMLRGVASAPLPDQSANVLRRIAEIETTSHDAAMAADAAMSADAATSQANHAGSSRAGAGTLLGWLWQPRAVSVQWRPAYGLAAVAALTLLLVRPSANPVTPPVAIDERAPQVLVQFRLDAPGAEDVSLAGDFTDWQPAHTMTRSDPGVWTVVVALDPGVHDYAFIVDGEQWVADPMAPSVGDGFGGLNSRLAVLTPDERRPL